MEVPAQIASYVAITGMLWAAFSGTEKLLKPSTLKDLSAWLYGERLPGMARVWIGGFLEAFDQAFRVRKYHRVFAIPSFVRATLVSLAFVLVLYGIAAVTEHFVFRSLWQHLVQLARSEEFVEAAYFVEQLRLATWVLGGLLIAILVDFISLTESRWVIGRIVTSHSSLQIVIWLLVDLCLTTALALIGFACTWYAASILIEYVTGGRMYLAPKLSVDLAFGLLISWLRQPHYIGTEIEKIFFYSAYFTSLWVWMFCLGGIALRAAYWLQPVRTSLAKHFKVAAQPLTVAGWVANAVFSVLYWGTVALYAMFAV